MSMHIVIVGATSAIAREIARRYAAGGASFALIARDHDRAEAIGHDLRARGALGYHVVVADLAVIEDHARVVQACTAALPTIDLVVVAHGVLPDQTVCDVDVDAALAAFSINANSAISITHRFVGLLEAQGSGTVVVLSSVAGDRGRRSNYVYGAAKAALSTYVSGLRSKARARGVHVVTVKPGLVDTPMTAHLPKNALFVTSTSVAKAVVHAVERHACVIYAPWMWRPVMALIRALPERLFMRIRA